MHEVNRQISTSPLNTNDGKKSSNTSMNAMVQSEQPWSMRSSVIAAALRFVVLLVVHLAAATLLQWELLVALALTVVVAG